ncbi:MAG TPA: hypothetical protein VKB05_20770 [Pyrinomonadaceae bacterium]|nr:hypothetical protein [Pyrinomonadaceae bacterium]
MRILVGSVIIFFVLISAVVGQQVAPPASGKLTGRWQVSFALNSDAKKNLSFEAKGKGAGSFSLLDTGPDNKPVPDPVSAAWSELTNNRVSFSGEVELPLGSCCREFGTLMFKGRFESADSIKGSLIFVTSVDEEESPYKFHSAVGTFTATRLAK